MRKILCWYILHSIWLWKKLPWQLENVIKNCNSSPKMNSEIPNSHNFLTLYAQSHKLAERSEGEGREGGKTWVRGKNKNYWYRVYRETNKWDFKKQTYFFFDWGTTYYQTLKKKKWWSKHWLKWLNPIRKMILHHAWIWIIFNILSWKHSIHLKIKKIKFLFWFLKNRFLRQYS